jgi:hypothetical protein
MNCEPLKYLRCDIIAGASLVVNRRNRCQWVAYEQCSEYLHMAFREGWELRDTDFGLCCYEPGESHAESLLMSLKRAPCYARNCGIDHKQWRKAMRRERRFL